MTSNVTFDKLQVGRAGQKKKARMARTRSDFLTRSPPLSLGGDSDEDDYDGDSPLSPRHFTLPLSKPNTADAGLGQSCFSDSDMVNPAPSKPKPNLFPRLLSDTSNPLPPKERRISTNFCFP